MFKQIVFFPSLLHEVKKIYHDDDELVSHIRARHLDGLVALTPYMTIANLLAALLLVWTYVGDVSFAMWIWLFTILLQSLQNITFWWRRTKTTSRFVSVQQYNRTTWHATLHAIPWALLPIFWFCEASIVKQITITAYISGMLGAGAIMLSSAPKACIAYLSILTLGGLGGLLRTADPAFICIAVMLLFYALTLALAAIRTWGSANKLLQLRLETKRQHMLLELFCTDVQQPSRVATWEIDQQGYLVDPAERLLEILQLAPQDHTRTLADILAIKTKQRETFFIKAILDNKPFHQISIRTDIDGHEGHLLLSGRPFATTNAARQIWRGIIEDVTPLVSSTQQLWDHAQTDSLTRLANSIALRQTLREAMHNQHPFGLLVIGLDHFKAVNDSFGQEGGDELLKGVAARLQSEEDGINQIFKLHGDEFAVMMLGVSCPNAARNAADALLKKLVKPLALGLRQVQISASAGLAMFDEAGDEKDDVWLRADIALREAKSGTRGNITLFSNDLAARRERRLKMESNLQTAAEQGELSLHWQAKVDLTTNRICGAEALMRWDSKLLGRVAPDEFIVLAERCGLIEKLGGWAIGTAIGIAAKNSCLRPIAVNVSPMQLRSGSLVKQVTNALETYGLTPSDLELEITETVFIQDTEHVLKQLHALRSLGVRIALDDFGTGYSSLAYLRRFPFSTLKIDRTFIRDIAINDEAFAVVKMMTALAKTLGMRTVAEGIEDSEQLSAVRAAGCDEVQGYFLARPATLADFILSFERK